jgi:7 transmembrane receptor (rhodopsin family).
MIFLTIKITLFTLIILANLVVIIIFKVKPKLTEKPSNRLLQSLSLCDMLTGFSVLLHVVIGQYPSLQDSFPIRITAEIITTWLVETSTLHLVFVTADRALSLFKALEYRDMVTRMSVKTVIIAIWVVPFLTSTCQLFYLYPFFGDYDISKTDDKRIAKFEFGYSIASFILYMLFPLAFMGIAFLAMFREIRKLLLRTPSTGQQTSTPGVISWQQRRVIYIFSAMYACFLFLAIPYFSMRLYIDIRVWQKKKVDVTPEVLNILYILKTTTSLCNPLLYSGLNREFRAVFFGWIKKRGTTLRSISLLQRRSGSDSGFRDTDFDQSPTTRSRILSLDEVSVHTP